MVSLRKFLVIGGTGFISSRLVQRLLDAGHRVTAFTRGMSTSRFAKTDKLDFLYGDRRNEADLKQAVHRRTFDAIYDMVAYEPEES